MLAATGKCVGFSDCCSSLVELTCKQNSHRLVYLSNRKVRWVIAADMTRNEEIFPAVGAVKGMKLRGTNNKWLATAWKVGGVGRMGRCRQWLLA